VALSVSFLPFFFGFPYSLIQEGIDLWLRWFSAPFYGRVTNERRADTVSGKRIDEFKEKTLWTLYYHISHLLSDIDIFAEVDMVYLLRSTFGIEIEGIYSHVNYIEIYVDT
jgi:hypothetical protein